MADLSKPSSGSRRSAVYSYLRPLVTGRRVLEIGCGNGDATALLVRLGAKSAVGAGSPEDVSEAKARHREGALGFASLDSGTIAAAGSFDLILVPVAADLLRGRGAIRLSSLLTLIAPGGHLACVVENGDRGEGVPYFDVVDALTPHFSKVRMFGQTPFYAYGIAEFDEAGSDLRVESDLAGPEIEPTHYIALAGPDESFGLGYALVQIPSPDPEERSPGPKPVAAAPGKAPDAVLAELRLKLTESEGKVEGLVRVSRAQSEEIEELRARLRRTAEARADLDEEVRRLRHALIEADESVVNLTRRTTEEMTALAQRLTAGLREGGPAPSPALAEELRRRESELAECESAISERDDRIAGLEVAKQEAIWRADAVDDELAQARAELTELRGEHQRTLEQASASAEMEAQLKAKEATIEDFRRAAAVHVDEVRRLRDAANEQASLVTELEEALRDCERRFADKLAEASQLQRMLSDVEGAERVRRSRLAELEGLMLRAEHASARETEARDRERTENDDLRARLAACQSEGERLRKDREDLDDLRARLAACQSEAESLRDDRKELDHLHAFFAASQSERERLRRDCAELDDVRARLTACQSEREGLRTRLAELEKGLSGPAAPPADDAGRAELEAKLRAYQDRDQRLAELRAEAPDPEEVYERLFDLETQYQAATMAAARVPELEAKLAELERRLAGQP